MTVIDKDKGWNNIQKELQILKKGSTKVGLQSGEPVEGEPMLTMAELGSIHEFGTKDGDIPARPFMSTTFDDNKKNLNNFIAALTSKVMQGNMPAKQAVALLGEWYEAKIKSKINSIRFPPNAPTTIARKGSSKPLIDTGQMRNSIRHVDEV
jgi:hypothetical protein